MKPTIKLNKAARRRVEELIVVQRQYSDEPEDHQTATDLEMLLKLHDQVHGVEDG